MRRTIYLLSGLILVLLAACSKYQIPAAECPDGNSGLSYQSDIQPIFNTNCIACHSGSQAPDLSDGWSHDELLGGGYVEDPEFACESALYQILDNGTHAGRVTDEELMDILGWIQDGAPDN